MKNGGSLRKYSSLINNFYLIPRILFGPRVLNDSVKKYLVIGLSIVFNIMVLAPELAAQKDIVVSGNVYERDSRSADTLYPVANINVINLKGFYGTVTSRTGYFSLEVEAGDTLIFSSISHIRDTFICNASEVRKEVFLNVVLKPRYHELHAIEVYGKDFEGFRHDFVHLEVRDTFAIRLAPQWTFEPVKEGFGITINGPLTALWNAFSKQGKEMRKLAQLIEEERNRAYMESVYKRPVVLRFLELDEDEIEGLVKFCNFSKQYVAQSTDYELLSALEKCYETYKSDY